MKLKGAQRSPLLVWNLQRLKELVVTCRSSLVSGTWVKEKMAVLRKCLGESVRRPGASSSLSFTVCLWRLRHGSRPVISPRAQPPAERPGLEWLIHWLAALPLSIIHSSFTSPFFFSLHCATQIPSAAIFCSSHFVSYSALLLFILYKKRAWQLCHKFSCCHDWHFGGLSGTSCAHIMPTIFINLRNASFNWIQFESIKKCLKYCCMACYYSYVLQTVFFFISI